MAIREDLVVSAAKFLQDPSVASSPPENRVAFLKAKNLTPEEITAALARAGFDNGGNAGPVSYGISPQPSAPPQQQTFYGNPYGQPLQYPPYGWQPPPPPEALPRRDWRDWFIMATVVGGVGYGLYSMTKRYVYPLVAPPTPDRLEQDKKAIDEQFERAFALVDQLAKDTDELKAAEKERTERLDQALTNLETVINELKTASKRREEDAERLRDDVRGLKDALPKALDTQREVTDGRLREVNTELKGLKTLIGQRMGGGSTTTGSSSVNGGPSYLRAASVAPSSTSAPSVVSVESEGTETANKAAATPSANPLATTVETVSNNSGNSGFVSGYSAANLTSNSSSPAPAATSPPSSFSSSGKASIPAWQRAMQKPAASTNGTTSSSSAQPEASGSA
ncbi:peroxisomal membrane anchor protein [Sporothrix schenckii 1099-18]|uniref:Peroxisomal membrane protein PEX14 n=1 Tax=Sporothrix schenckii 1099-18 TaxID=1397361 RepID=A0A0F2M7W7_SPOSC|nr:peroxisomal membrane anchor protein [Sporothrix schenckii 1099-18]KJR85732.1 peroxisomal membrane anchor protein [Sporothrix schenckii 1099-18]